MITPKNAMPLVHRRMSPIVVWLVLLAALSGWFRVPSAEAQPPQPASPESTGNAEAKPEIEEGKPKQLTLAVAAMCEGVDGLSPVNKAAVFSVSMGKVNCFTVFNPVPETTQIYHRWYHRGELSTQIRLRVNPPRWATYSLIQLRETDKGPWRVEITDANNRVLGVLRFSITD